MDYWRKVVRRLSKYP